MTARRRKTSFASLLRHASRWDEANAAGRGFRVDPTHVRLWNGLAAPSPEECRDQIATIAREGQFEPVTVRPVFDDEHYEYEVIAGARDWVAVRHLRDTAMPRLDLLVRVELVDDDAVADLAANDPEPDGTLPDPIGAAFGGEAIPADAAAVLAERLDGPMAPIILATAGQIARAQDARRGDGLPPYPAAEVMRLIDTVSGDAPPIEPLADPLSLAIIDASANGVTFRLDAASDLPPETLARVVKAMIDGATADGIAVKWAIAPTAATSP
jgi:ParB family chromosome partitioning protein